MPLDTILCLDTSGSMANKGMNSLKEAVAGFLTGVTQTALQTGLKENVAVVEFGAKVRIVCPLTDNYLRVARSVDLLSAGGSTPMFEGLMEALKEIIANGGVVRLPGGIRLTPRIILMTDGHPDDGDKVKLVALMFSPKGYSEVGLPHPVPIACVGCGNNVDTILLQFIAAVTNGMYVIGDISELSDFFKKQMLLVRFIVQMQGDLQKLRDIMVLKAFLEACGEDSSEEELASPAGQRRAVGGAGPRLAITGPTAEISSIHSTHSNKSSCCCAIL